MAFVPGISHLTAKEKLPGMNCCRVMVSMRDGLERSVLPEFLEDMEEDY